MWGSGAGSAGTQCGQEKLGVFQAHAQVTFLVKPTRNTIQQSKHYLGIR
jgi:hypothetical protein